MKISTPGFNSWVTVANNSNPVEYKTIDTPKIDNILK